MQPLDISYLYLSDIGKSKHEIITAAAVFD